MDTYRELTTKEKALTINLNPSWYGSFAEIGAGQEIADHFFKAGGASGTIAKTMSAYDMKFSDAIYGKTKRYVTRNRLHKMLDHEYKLLEERLGEQADSTCFFALANTVETLNYKKTNRGHGWLGVRFQLDATKEPNEIVLHMVLRDPEAIWQQEAIGIIGVNLLYACFHAPHDANLFIRMLMEGLSPDRVEIDMLRMDGHSFDWVDNRLLSLKLVEEGLTNAAMFGPDKRVLQASEVLYKKNILVLRGRFRPATLVNMDMLRSGLKQYLNEEEVEAENVVTVAELTLSNLTTGGVIDEKDYLDRVDILCSLGFTVMISNFHPYYQLVSYLTQFNRKKKMGIVLGVYNLEQIFDEQYYTDLKGGILEAFGILFGTNVKLYVYPSRIEYSQELYSCERFQLPRKELYHLFQYLFDTNKIEDIQNVDPDLLHITSDDVLEMIATGIEGWESMVPKEVEKAVKEGLLLGYNSEKISTQ